MEVPQKTKNRNIKWSSNPNPGHTSTREREVAQSCPTLCDPMDCSLPSSSVHGIFQAIVLEWIAISFSRESSRPRDRTQVSRIVGRCFTVWATREVLLLSYNYTICDPMDFSLTGFLHPWDFPGKSTGVGRHFLLQGIFPTQGSNPGLPHCRQMLYRLSHQGSPQTGLVIPFSWDNWVFMISM